MVNESSGRIWGTGTFEYWFALDSDRLKKSNFIAVDHGHSIKPAFTCTDNKKAFEIIRKLVDERKGKLNKTF